MLIVLLKPLIESLESNALVLTHGGVLSMPKAETKTLITVTAKISQTVKLFSVLAVEWFSSWLIL